MPDAELTGIHREYARLTPGSAELMERAAASMPRGLTRTLSYFAPYPVVFDHGSGAGLYDVDGNRYVDLFNNGLSLMHGHAYRPIEQALRNTLERGTAWPGTSDAQIEYAEMLCARLPGAEQVRFANTGTEAMMLAVKLARHVTGHELIIKAWDAYHGSYDDLEVGLQGLGEIPGRVALATFGALDTYADALERHKGEVAAIVVEPVQYTGVVTPPPEGFLTELRKLADDAGVLLILDDCLMFRLAEAGSAEKYGIEPDLTCLGKFIGGGLPVGVVAGPEKLMSALDPSLPDSLYHGGSFNGNPLGCAAGRVTMEHLTKVSIEEMDRRTERMATALRAKADVLGVPFKVSGDGSVLGTYIVAEDGSLDRALSARLHLAAINHGVYFGQDGEMAMATTLDDEALEEAIVGLEAALEAFAEELAGAGEVAG